jgi:hypothetical protein
LFYFECKVIKGFRYRYLFIWKDYVTVDKSGGNSFNNSKGGLGRETNFIEVDTQDSDQALVSDYFNQFNPDFTKQEIAQITEPCLQKMKSNFNHN